MTNKQKTHNALNSAYLMSNNKINESYLNETLQLYIANDRNFYDQIQNKRIKATSLAWQVLAYDANARLKDEEYPKAYSCTSEQLKSWLDEYGNGYESIAETVKYIENERNENNDKN